MKEARRNFISLASQNAFVHYLCVYSYTFSPWCACDFYQFLYTNASSFISANLQHDDQFNSQYGLTQAGLEEYSRSYYEQNMMYNHQKQSSYAQSEGYHSYVSSSDSTSTPFLDRWENEENFFTFCF